MGKYEITDTNDKKWKVQLRAFIQDTQFIGIFKFNVTQNNKHVGERILGITARGRGQLVAITRIGDHAIFEW